MLGGLSVSDSQSVIAAARRRALERPRSFAGRTLAGVLVVAGCLLCSPLQASQVKILRTTGAADFGAGEAKGIGIDALGVLRLAPAVRRVAQPEEPFLFAAARHPDGWVVATGNAGKVLLISDSGDISELLVTEEPEVFAVHVGDDGSVYAGSSPDGKVYKRAPDGTTGVLFAPGERYIWDLEPLADGRLLVATGVEGKVFVIDESDSSATLFYDDRDTHARSLLVQGDTVYLGTAGEGRVLRIIDTERAATLFDADQPEITDLLAGPDGSLFAAAVASEGSFVQLPASSSNESESSSSDQESQEVKVTTGAVAAGSRPAGFTGARSVILQLDPNGSADSVAELTQDTVYTMLWRDRLWLGTGQEGKIYSVRNGQLVLEQDLDDAQVIELLASDSDPDGFAIATTSGAGLHRSTREGAREGSYTSKVLDAGHIARFGTLHWNGRVPDGATVGFRVRSGTSALPDETWSDWTEASAGREILIGDVPQGRYFQWRVDFSGSEDSSPEVRAVDVSYVQQNRRPTIESLEVLPPGEILVPNNFNPSNQAFERAHPNRDGIFTTLAGPARDTTARSKKLWKLGYRTLRWKAADPNSDELRYAISFKRESDAPDDSWLQIVDDVEATSYGFDSTVLPDGYYRFRLVASDEESQGEQAALQAERVTGQIVVDHSAPVIERARRAGDDGWQVMVGDELSPIQEASLSIDAKSWQPLRSADGLLDARSEVLNVSLDGDESLVLLRLVDAAHNSVTLDLRARLAEESSR